MHLVTLLAACIVGATLPCAPSSPARTFVAECLPAIPVRAASVPADLDVRLSRWQPFIREASWRFGLPEAWIRAVMAAESGGRQTLHGQPVTSSAGAMGLMQVMPETYGEMRLRHRLGADPYDPFDNILAGAAYLRLLYDRYGYPGFFAAYNAGPERFDDYLLHGIPLPEETRRYLLSINPQLLEAMDFEYSPRLGQRLDNGSQTAAPPSGGALFFPLGPGPVTPAGATLSPHCAGNSAPDSIGRSPFSGGLFVPLTSPQGTAKHAGR
jgi:hypothetical protein